MQLLDRTIDLCVPVTDIFRRNQAALLPLVGAVSHKRPDGERIGGKVEMLESSLNIAAADFPRRIEADGWLAALKTGRFASFSCDIGPACDVATTRSSNGYPRYVALSPVCSEDEYVARSLDNVRFLRREFGGPIKVENLNYFPVAGHEVVCEPAVIRRLIEACGIELLLDIGHLTISAANLGIPVDTYLAGLPLERVSELHVSGSRIINGVLEDAHDVPDEREFALIAAILARTSPRYLTVEYYRDDALLMSAYRELSRRFVEETTVEERL